MFALSGHLDDNYCRKTSENGANARRVNNRLSIRARKLPRGSFLSLPPEQRPRFPPRKHSVISLPAHRPASCTATTLSTEFDFSSPVTRPAGRESSSIVANLTTDALGTIRILIIATARRFGGSPSPDDTTSGRPIFHSPATSAAHLTTSRNERRQRCDLAIFTKYSVTELRERRRSQIAKVEDREFNRVDSINRSY